MSTTGKKPILSDEENKQQLKTINNIYQESRKTLLAFTDLENIPKEVKDILGKDVHPVHSLPCISDTEMRGYFLVKSNGIISYERNSRYHPISKSANIASDVFSGYTPVGIYKLATVKDEFQLVGVPTNDHGIILALATNRRIVKDDILIKLRITDIDDKYDNTRFAIVNCQGECQNFYLDISELKTKESKKHESAPLIVLKQDKDNYQPKN